MAVKAAGQITLSSVVDVYATYRYYLLQSSTCGEVGIRFTNSQGASRELLPTDELSGEYFDNDMNYFDFTSMECFEEFFNIFINFVSVKTKLCAADNELRTDLADLPNKVSGFHHNGRDYQDLRRDV